MNDNQQDLLAQIVREVLEANRSKLGASYTSSPAIREALVTILAMSVEVGNNRAGADVRAAAERAAYQLREDIIPFLE
ncbi:hypothetical protein [Rhizorhabdus argentea]|uniref:hypothetical protein n=1 Tax=Rhizorhabdus argentea TaxID=1387174 RepID=UPI0030EDE0FE